MFFSWVFPRVFGSSFLFVFSFFSSWCLKKPDLWDSCTCQLWKKATSKIVILPVYPQHQGSVCMVYGLNSDKMNAARIFNLFCLYGNVVRVKFLWTKQGTGAMVQMGDALAVERVVSNLNNTSFFGSKMHLISTNQAWRQVTMTPFQLTDGTPSFQGKIICSCWSS